MLGSGRVIATLVFGLVVALGDARAAENPPLPAKSPASPADAASDNRPDVWSDPEIADARRRCDIILKDISAKITWLAPIKKGPCGTPAPIRLASIQGDSGELVFSPQPTLSCAMLPPLKRWNEKALQPLARRHLQTGIKRVAVMSSYSCRTRYGRKGARLSEHAVANAIDIGGFETTDGRRVRLLKHWGPTKRDLEAIAAKAAAARRRAALEEQEAPATNASPERAGAPPLPGLLPPRAPLPVPAPGERTVSGAFGPSGAEAGSTDRPRKSRQYRRLSQQIPREFRGLARRFLGTRSVPPDEDDLGRDRRRKVVAGPPPPLPVRRPLRKAIRVRKEPPYRLGGPKRTRQDNRQPKYEAHRKFLREAHTMACRIFGTVLGPEANDAHRNHFHLDMHPRRRGGYCE